MRSKLIKVTTVPLSLDLLLEGQLKYLNQYYNVIGVSSNGDSLTNVGVREGIEVHSINMRRNIAPFSDLIAFWKLYKYFVKEKPDIVHSITPKAGLLSMSAAYFSGVPIRLHTFTGLIFPHKKGILKIILILTDKLTCRFSTKVYPEGKGVKNELEQYNITSNTLKVIGNGNVNGIDTSFFSLKKISHDQLKKSRNELNFFNKDFVFLFVGRIVKDKGLNELVNAFTMLVRDNYNCKLLLVGPYEDNLDPILDKTRELIDSNSKIITTGYQQDVRKYYALSNVFVLPSYREGFPNVVLQAGAMELPSIVTDINGCNEIIEHEVNGLIVEKKNTSDLYSAMKKLYKNKELRERLSFNSRKMIVDRFEQKEFWNILLQEYRSLQK